MRAARYLRLAAIFAGASVGTQLEYRANFLVNLLSSLLASAGALFGLGILFGGSTFIGGWTYREAVVIVGLFTFVQGCIGAFLRPNLNRIAEAVRLGTMDFTLLKPIDAQFLVSAREVNIFHLADMLIGLGITVWAISGLSSVHAPGVALGLVLLLAALLIVYALWFMLSTTAFWFVNVANVTELFNGIFQAGQFPVTAFPIWVRFLFTFIVPVAFITTVPAEAIIGRVQPAGALGAIMIALALLATSRWFWRFAVRNYTSASS